MLSQVNGINSNLVVNNKAYMKVQIDIKFADEWLSLEGEEKSDYIHGFIFEELSTSRELLSVKDVTGIPYTKCETENNTETKNVILEVIIEIPDDLFGLENSDPLFNYISANLDTKHVQFLQHYWCGNDQHVIIEMDEKNPSLNYDYSDFDL